MVHILYSDGDVAVCEKPVGILSEGQAPDALPALLSEKLGAPVFPVHRLDRGTQGLMVFALTSRAAADLSRQITLGTFKKEYLAVVCGTPREEEGSLTDLLFYDRRAGKSFVATRSRKGVKEARLDYRVLESRGERSLIRVLLHTGRTHQIRVQFASRGLPLAGDRRYGAPAGDQTVALCSHTLAFTHPRTGEPLAFRALPAAEEGTPWEAFSHILGGQEHQNGI